MQTAVGGLGHVLRLVAGCWAFVLVSGLAILVWLTLTGHRLEVVTTASMSPSVPTGALAVVGPVDPDEVAVGDVVTYSSPGHARPILHRVVDVVDQPSGRFLRTKGDANVAIDGRAVPIERVSGRLRWTVPRLGSALWHLRPPGGLVALVGLPLGATAVAEWRHRSTRSQPTRRSTPCSSNDLVEPIAGASASQHSAASQPSDSAPASSRCSPTP